MSIDVYCQRGYVSSWYDHQNRDLSQCRLLLAEVWHWRSFGGGERRSSLWRTEHDGDVTVHGGDTKCGCTCGQFGDLRARQFGFVKRQFRKTQKLGPFVLHGGWDGLTAVDLWVV